MSVLRYCPAPESSWFHYLYGPRREGGEGWILHPDSAPLSADHLSRITAAVRGFDVLKPRDFSLTIVNPSLGEAGLQPGRGGLAVVLHFQLRDHRGTLHRFAHALACYDRGLDLDTLHGTIWTFLRRVTRGRQGPDRPIDRDFTGYMQAESRERALDILRRYLRRIEPFDFIRAEAPRRELRLEEGGLWPDVLDVTSMSETWEEVIHGIASISASLYTSTLPWSALTTSVVLPRVREGLIIRFLARPLVKREHPLVILEELDVERAAVALLPVVEQEVTQAAGEDLDWLPLYDERTEDRSDLPTDTGEPPPPPMLLEDLDTLTEDIIDLSAPLPPPGSPPEDLLGDPEPTESVVLTSPAVARPASPRVPPPPQRQPRRVSVYIGAALLVVLVALAASRMRTPEVSTSGLEAVQPDVEPTSASRPVREPG